MKPTVTYEEVLERSKTKKIGFVDVRSPKEYQNATIPGAVNIPILDNQTRETVGTLYVNGEISQAKEYGIGYASSKLPEMYRQYERLLEEYDELALFCSRGGMRSRSIFALLKALGMPVSRIQGGYKGYRHYILEHLEEQITQVQFVTLYGLSGTGKTAILKELSNLGESVLDLEGCANHRGSLLGGVGLTPAHSQKMFESYLFESSKHWQKDQVVFTEGESKRIGRVVMPSFLAEKIQAGSYILIEASLAYRIEKIYQDYIETSSLEELIQALDQLKGMINPEKVISLQEALKQGEGATVIEQLLVSYYDPRYSHKAKKYDLTLTTTDPKETAEKLVQLLHLNE